MKSFFCYFSTLIIVGLAFNPAFAGDLLLGKAKVETLCQTCHGVDGQGTIAGVPNLSGQNYDYLVIQLKAFRATRRQHAQMSIIAKMLSNADIENVAAWYSSIKVSLKLPN
jgi:cytochrome c553